MSQAGEIDVVGNNPDIPTEFITNDGIAVPIANQLEILGTYVAAGSIPVETKGSGNTVTIDVQTTQKIAASDVTKIGLAAFDSSAFNVDANGFVTLAGGGGATTDIDVDAHTAPGTDPVVPNAGNIIMTGAQVASGVVGANVIRTDSLAANTVTIEIQRSAAVAATDSTKNGVSHFDSSKFTVDANGFVSLISGAAAVDTLTGNTGGAIAPVAGNINTVGSGSITTAGSGSTLTTQLTGLTNHSVQVGAGTATLTQLTVGTNGQVLVGSTGADPAFATLTSSDSSITFTPGANSLSLQVASGTTVGKTITGNSGGALSPTAGNWNILTNNTTVKFVGSGSTLTQDFGLTNLLIGSSGSSITSSAGNVGIGLSSLTALSSGSNNVCIGYFAGNVLATATGNTFVGGGAGISATSGSNTFIGRNSGGSAISATLCTIVGDGAYGGTTGTNIVALGQAAASSYNGSESSNICISNVGTTGESHTIRIGTQGTLAGQHNTCFIAGINGVTTSNSEMVTINTSTGQLGAASIPAGTVTSVSGILNRITSTGGATPVIDISSSYVGQNSITTLGTITTGTWNGTIVDLAHGGTNANLTASNGGIFYSTASAGAILAGTATASQVLLSGASTTPAWSTAVYPSAVATAGKQLRSDGSTGWVASTIVWGNALTANNLLYASSTNTQGQLASANNGTLVTSATGVPSILAGPGTTGNILQSNASAAPSFSTATYPSTTTSQQILYSTAANTVGELTTANSKFPATNASGTLAMRSLSVVIQTFTSAGTYTPTTGMVQCIIEIAGGGGGGGGSAANGAANISVAGGGGAGEYAKGVFSAATVGASQVVTIGAAGAAGTAGNNTGGAGGNSSVGALISANGGSGGPGGPSVATGTLTLGGLGGTGGSGGSYRVNGLYGQYGFASSAFSFTSGSGGSGPFGNGGVYTSNAAGNTGTGNGVGGSGASGTTSAAAFAGGAGTKGIVIITEYVIA